MLLKCVNTGSQNGNCYILENDTEALILDAGVRYNDVLKALDYNISKVTGLLLTHEHGDHAKAFKDFIRSGIPVYGCDELQEHLEIVAGEKMIGLPERIPKRIGSWTVVPFYIPHTTRDKETGALIPCPNFGYLIKNSDEVLLYATDFEYIPYTFKNQSINYMLLECNHMDDLMDSGSANYVHALKGHSSVSTVRDIILANKTSDLRNIILCHLSSENADPDRMKQEIQEVAGKWVRVEVAEKNSVVSLSKYPF